MQSQWVYDLNEENFTATLEKSQQTPILVHLWAPSIPESSQIIETLKQTTLAYQGALELALVNCEQEQTIAAQFGVQTLPTLVLLSQGRALDGLAGPQTAESITQMLTKHLPSQDETDLKKALELVEQEAFDEALPLLQNLDSQTQGQPEAQLALAACFLHQSNIDGAKTLLSSIPLQYQDNTYKALMAQIELHAQAANSPELQQLEEKLQQNPEDLHLIRELAIQYHQVKRDDEALSMLIDVLQKDLNALDGEIKAECMTILSALGQNHPVAKQYRRRLYALLY